jgi:hypothetical protein
MREFSTKNGNFYTSILKENKEENRRRKPESGVQPNQQW